MIAQASIGTGAGTSVHGQLIALTGAVTLINTSIVNNLCNVPSPIVTATPEATIPTTVVVPAVVPAKLHIIKVVVNREAGKATAATFSIRVTHNGIDVAGSPGQGVGGVGATYILAPGDYILCEVPTEDYRGEWTGPITAGGSVTLLPGQDVTVTRTNYDMSSTSISPTTVVTTVPVIATPIATPKAVIKTVTGGKLPATASPWGNWLVGGNLLILLGGIAFIFRKVLVK